MKRIRVLTWHVHGNYLYYLSQANCDFILPVKESMEEGYIGKTKNFVWGNNVHEIPASEVKKYAFDCILFQSKKNYHVDQFEILSKKQQDLPKVYLEHDPPREHPTDTKHPAYNDALLVVHVTNFNDLMWDCGSTPTLVIEHGVCTPPGLGYKGRIAKGLVVINNLSSRGRRLGADIVMQIKRHIPLDIVGMNSEKIGGIGEIPYKDLPKFMSDYRFLFSPIRYTSLGLSICEAMSVGLPVVGLATTELPNIIKNGRNGFIDTNIDTLLPKMKELLKDIVYAKRLSRNARSTARRMFSITRFAKEWEEVFTVISENRKTKLVNKSLREVFAKVS